MLFSVKAACFGISVLRRLVTLFIAFEVLVDGSAADSLVNYSCFILLEELVGVDNHIGVYGGGEFYY